MRLRGVNTFVHPTIRRGMDDPPSFAHDFVRDSSGPRGIVRPRFGRRSRRSPESPVPPPVPVTNDRGMDDSPSFLHDSVRDSSGPRGFVRPKSRKRGHRSPESPVPNPLFPVTIDRGMDDPPSFLHDFVRDSSGHRGIVPRCRTAGVSARRGGKRGARWRGLGSRVRRRRVGRGGAVRRCVRVREGRGRSH